uniref:Uncharacterized protein n=1 Tax=Leptobrachium leishanense TaxID=445787 RepID=A0A8C5PRA5_9ANUR
TSTQRAFFLLNRSPCLHLPQVNPFSAGWSNSRERVNLGCCVGSSSSSRAVPSNIRQKLELRLPRLQQISASQSHAPVQPPPAQCLPPSTDPPPAHKAPRKNSSCTALCVAGVGWTVVLLWCRGQCRRSFFGVVCVQGAGLWTEADTVRGGAVQGREIGRR